MMTSRRTIYLVTGGVFLFLFCLFYFSGALTASYLPRGYSSELELIGQAYMFLCMVPYLVLAFGLGRIYSLTLVDQIDAAANSALKTMIQSYPLTGMAIGAMAGIINGLFQNTSSTQRALTMELDPIASSIVFGNVATWTLCGMGLAYRIHVAWQFHHHAQSIEIDLFDVSALKPYARNGLADALIIFGAIALTTLQALDATFRTENFANAFVVAVPAVLGLFFFPLYGTHRRISKSKAEQMEAVQALIRKASKGLETDKINELEILLQRRERISAAPTWPIDLSMLWRLFFYGVIPPAAWVAAAFVEILLQTRLEG